MPLRDAKWVSLLPAGLGDCVEPKLYRRRRTRSQELIKYVLWQKKKTKKQNQSISMNVSLACVSVDHNGTWCPEARRGHWVSWNLRELVLSHYVAGRT